MPVTGRLAAAAAATAAALATVAVPSPVAAAGTTVNEVYPVPQNGVYTVAGHGWGHGHGMSQWGAYGAAKVDGLSAAEILAFYYPGTSLTTRTARAVRVRMHASGGSVVVAPISGQTLTATTTVTGVPACTLPPSVDSGASTVRWWRAVAVVTAGTTAVALQETNDGRTWQQVAIPGCDPAWSRPLDGSVTFADGPTVALVTGSGTVTRYRGQMRAAFTGSAIYPVDVVALEAYLRSVVPSEMPASWSAAALQAQAVAARTYATYGIQHPKTAYYDVWDDTRDQAYTGVASEDPRSDAAVTSTVGQVLLDGNGHAAFTQFGAADGGWTAAGGQSYLPAQRDPYDGAVPNTADTWTTTLTASAVSAAFSGQIGALQEIDVTGRDGHGQWGGRVTSMTLRGTTGSLVVSGTTFRSALGLRSEWFHMQVPPAPPTYVTAAASGSTATVTWQPPASSSGAPVTGYRVSVLPDGPVQEVSASARRATVSGLSTDPVEISVAAESNVGVGAATTVTTKLRRLVAGDATGVAVGVSRATFANDAARSVVLTGLRRWNNALAAGAFASAHGAPVLFTNATSLPAATRAEIRRVLPAGRVVYLVGPMADIGDQVRIVLRALGYRVVRFAGADAASTAALLATQTRGLRGVIEVSGRSWQQALVAAPAAVAEHAALLLTDGTRQDPVTWRWIAAHRGLPRWALGAAAAAADPRATPVRGANVYQLARAAAQTFFASPTVVGIAGSARFFPALVAGARLGRVGAPLLLSTASGLPPATSGYLTATRSTVAETDLVGGGLAYYDVESGIQAILVGGMSPSASR